MELERELRRLLDKRKIEEQLYNWSRGTARKDWALVRSIFDDNAQDDHGTLDASLDDFIAWQKKHHSGISHSVHFIGMVSVDFADDDHALSESYVTAYHHYTSEDSRADIVGPEAAAKMGEMNSLIVGRYLDKFKRFGDTWKITYRQAVFETAQTWEGGRNLLPQWVGSQRDETDPLYKLRAEMGLGSLV